MRSPFDGPTPTRRPERYRQTAAGLLRQLNLLICGGDVEELQDLVAALVSTQAYATARLMEERRARQLKAHGQPTAGNGAAHTSGNGSVKPEAREVAAPAAAGGNDSGAGRKDSGAGSSRGTRVGNGTPRGGRAA
jgi:hypothetical protein